MDDAGGHLRFPTIESARAAALLALPRPVWAYVEGGAEKGWTASANMSAFADWNLFPSIPATAAMPDLSSTVMGHRVELPLIFAPVGMLGLIGRGGERSAAAATKAAGGLFILSTAATTSLEDLAATHAAPRIFQLNPPRDRSLATSLVDRARDAGYDDLWITVDNPTHGYRPGDLEHGLRFPMSWTTRLSLALSRPRWAAAMAGSRPGLANFEGLNLGFADILDQIVSPCGWDDLEWLRDRWRGNLAVKGLLRPSDVDRAAQLGFDAVILSNQGGRHFDSGVTPLSVLPAAVEAAANRLEIILDGGIRSGADVIKAICLGATACSTARPFCYGLAAAGAAGVRSIFDLFRAEMLRTMRFMGCRSIADLGLDRLQRHSRFGQARRGG